MSSTPRTDAYINAPAGDIFAHACQLERELRAMHKVLLEIADYLDDHADVRDGYDGAPLPNEAMVLRQNLERFLPSRRGDEEQLA
jgi:hypothetical protein